MQLLRYAKALPTESTTFGTQPKSLDWLRGKNALQEMKASKSKDCETGKRGSILGERVSVCPFPTLSALCPPIFCLRGSRMILCCCYLAPPQAPSLPLVLKCLSWLFQPLHGGEETQKWLAGSPGLSPCREGEAPEVVSGQGTVEKLALDNKPRLSN